MSQFEAERTTRDGEESSSQTQHLQQGWRFKMWIYCCDGALPGRTGTEKDRAPPHNITTSTVTHFLHSITPSHQSVLGVNKASFIPVCGITCGLCAVLHLTGTWTVLFRLHCPKTSSLWAQPSWKKGVLEKLPLVTPAAWFLYCLIKATEFHPFHIITDYI